MDKGSQDRQPEEELAWIPQLCGIPGTPRWEMPVGSRGGDRAGDEALEVLRLEEMSHPAMMGRDEQRSRKRLWGNTDDWRDGATEEVRDEVTSKDKAGYHCLPPWRL